MKHAGAALTFSLLAILWSFPLIEHLPTHLPGEVVGDNVAFLWNLWWMRQAGTGFFFSPLLFAPYGVDLSLNTHTALQAAFAATVLGRLDVVTAQNIVVILTLALNGACSYWLAWDRTRSFGAALLAGVIFAGSPFLSAHLLGHFNLISAWPIPLFVLCVLRAVENHSRGWSVASGVALAALAYTDYYYVVYCLVLVSALIVWRSGLISIVVKPQRLGRGTVATVAGLLGLITIISVAIAVTGGFDGSVAGIRVRASEPGNLLTAGWLIVAAAAWRRIRPALHVNNGAWPGMTRDVRVLIPALLIFVVAVAPVLRHASRLVLAGDYSAPVHQWRSGPAGVDLLTLMLGNPFGSTTRAWTRGAYTALDFDHIEGVGWLGIVPSVALLWGTRRAWRDASVRPLVACSWFFLVWAFGPWLKIAGASTGLMLPANLFGLIPVLSNARIPGRAIVIVFLASGLLAARLAQSLQARFRWAAPLMCAIVIADFLPAPVPTVALDTPALYAAIPPGTGAVLELPMGLRDGFEEIGSFDERTLLYQMTHGHPLVGGFVARLPLSLKRRYTELPILRSLLALSDTQGPLKPQEPTLSSADAVSALRSLGVRYVVLDRRAASPQLVEFVAGLQLPVLDSDEVRQVLAVKQR